MKKTLLATAILAGLVSVSAQAATVYDQDGQTLKISGDIDALVYSNDSTAGTLDEDNYASINIKGFTKVSDTVTAYAEFEIDTDGYDTEISGTDTETSAFAIDELVVGLDTAYGDFSFAGVSSALGQISDFTDVGNEFGGNLEEISGGGASGFAYANTFGGLTLNAEYIASSDEDADSVGVSAVYSIDGLSLGLGYVTLDESNELALGLSYSIDALYVGLGYAMGESDATTDFTIIELAVTYGVTDDVTLMAFYGIGEEEVGSTTTDSLDYYAVEASYSFASNVSANVGYKVDNLDEDNTLYTSIQYDF
jgi:predicted porin